MITLFPHQQTALTETEPFNLVGYYLDMGLGKTYVGSEKMVKLNTKLNLVVCQHSKIDDWVDHFKTNYPDYEVHNCTNKGGLMFFLSCASMVQGGQYKMVGVINYDLIFRRPAFKSLEDFTLILDESSMIQNDTAKRSKFILDLKPQNVILLSGTPSSGKYENLWTQVHLLGWKISKDLFNKQYINWKKIDVGGFPMKVVDKDNPYKNVDRLKSKMREYGAIFMKSEEVFDLPAQTFIPVKVPTTKAYRKFRKEKYIQFDTLNLHEFKDDSDFYGNDVTPRIELIGDTTLTFRLYSRWLCGHLNPQKLQAFKDLCSSTKDRLIVFYNYDAELDALKKIADSLQRPISEVNGHVKDLVAYDTQDDSITFIQYKAGAMGLNLQKANKIIYFTLTDESELFEQSKKRIHRIGQNHPCFYYYMICTNSVEDTEILPTLNVRKEYSDELFRESPVSGEKSAETKGTAE